MIRVVIHTELDGTQTVLTDAPGGISVMMIDQRKPATGRVHDRRVQPVGPSFIDALLHRSTTLPTATTSIAPANGMCVVDLTSTPARAFRVLPGGKT